MTIDTLTIINPLRIIRHIFTPLYYSSFNSHDYSTVPLFLLCFHHALLCSHSQNMSGIAGKLLCICSHSISLLSEIHSHKMDKALIVPSMFLPPVLPEILTYTIIPPFNCFLFTFIMPRGAVTSKVSLTLWTNYSVYVPVAFCYCWELISAEWTRLHFFHIVISLWKS